MQEAFDLRDERVSNSLANAITWCGGLDFSLSPGDTEKLARRNEILEAAADLHRRAYQQQDGFWKRVFRRGNREPDKVLLQRARELSNQGMQIEIEGVSKGLRTPVLKPPVALADARSEESRQQAVQWVAAKRLDLVRGRPEPRSAASAECSAAGRLLLFSPDDTLSDGAAKVQSCGFFDDDNVPPWDTWVAFSQGTLLSWVPAQLVPLVERGVEVNPEECIHWMK